MSLSTTFENFSPEVVHWALYPQTIYIYDVSVKLSGSYVSVTQQELNVP